MKTLKIGIWILAIISSAFLILYLVQFNGCLSDSKADWGTFGDYLSGVFAVFNLAVVVLLTVYVKKSEDTRRTEELEFQSSRLHAEKEFNNYKLMKEIETQKAILSKDLENKKKVALLELNFDYLKSFENSFDKLVFTNFKDRLECMLIINSVTYNLIQISSIIETKLMESLLSAEAQEFNDRLQELSIAIFDSSEDSFYDLYASRIEGLTKLKVEYVLKVRECLLRTIDF